MHDFPITLRWQGSTADKDYSKDHEVRAEGRPAIPASSAAQYGGNPAMWTPEDLYAAAVANCHMLTFLALAAKARLDVRRYDGNAMAALDDDAKPPHITRVTLSPTIRIAPGTDEAKVRLMFEKAHKYCFIAQSVKAEIVLDPVIVEEPQGD